MIQQLRNGKIEGKTMKLSYKIVAYAALIGLCAAQCVAHPSPLLRAALLNATEDTAIARQLDALHCFLKDNNNYRPNDEHQKRLQEIVVVPAIEGKKTSLIGPELNNFIAKSEKLYKAFVFSIADSAWRACDPTLITQCSQLSDLPQKIKASLQILDSQLQKISTRVKSA
jgi:hypothetical protein